MGDTPSKYDTGWFTDADELGKPQTGLGKRDAAAVDKAKGPAEAFAKRGGKGVWPHLERAKVAAGLKYRLDNPDSFNQGQTWLCGIATFVRVWAYDHPVEYVQLAADLFEKGEGWLKGGPKTLVDKRSAGEKITTSSDLLNSAVARISDKESLDHADWVVLAAIRESFNSVFTYGADEGPFHIKAWNFPSDVVREFKAGGYSRVISKADGLGGGGYNNFVEATDLYDRGWRVILLIKSDLLKASAFQNPGAVRTSDHWVGLNSTVFMSLPGPNCQVDRFEVYSWDGPHFIPPVGQKIAFSLLDKYYFGFVAGLH
jgi:hypothetical protein